VVPLDLFPTNLLEGITTAKTFTPDQPGDFSGARVDLKTKEFPAGRQINIGVTAGFNTAVTGQNIAKAPTVSGDWFGNGAGPRALPSDVAAAGDLSGTNQAQLNTLKSQVAFGVLQAMRDASKTGGALGAVSDAEGKRLENNLAALDQAQDAESFKKAMDDIIRYVDETKPRLRSAFRPRLCRRRVESSRRCTRRARRSRRPESKEGKQATTSGSGSLTISRSELPPWSKEMFMERVHTE
jgi:hypothetical protein